MEHNLSLWRVQLLSSWEAQKNLGADILEFHNQSSASVQPVWYSIYTQSAACIKNNYAQVLSAH